jgi:hypothetical protein
MINLQELWDFISPTKGIVYREIKITKKTFNDPKWRKENPGLYDT